MEQTVKICTDTNVSVSCHIYSQHCVLSHI